MGDTFNDRTSDGAFRCDTDLDFVYTDFDSHANEIAELYGYSEEDEFFNNRDLFHELMEDHGLPLRWTDMTDAQKQRVLELLSNLLEVTDVQQRQIGIRCCLYLLQGAFGECTDLNQQAKYARELAFQLYENEMFGQFVHLLNIEQQACEAQPPSSACGTRTMADSLSQ
jgi:hypothetical protein